MEALDGRALREIVEAILDAGQKVVPHREGKGERLGAVILAVLGEFVLRIAEATRTEFVGSRIGVQILATSRKGDNLGQPVLRVKRGAVPGA